MILWRAQQKNDGARNRRPLIAGLAAVLAVAVSGGAWAGQQALLDPPSFPFADLDREPAAESSGAAYLGTARALYLKGQYFRAARYAFAGLERDSSIAPEAYAWVTASLAKARLYDSASYFFIKTLQAGDKAAIQRVLLDAQDILLHVGADLLRKYLIRHTQYEDYNTLNRSAYLYALGKDALLAGQGDRAIGYLNGISRRSPVWPFALELRGSAYAIRGDGERALEDFRQCARHADDITDAYESGTGREKQAESEAQDLAARCQAGVGRTLYQMERFDEADRAYDRVPKSSLVWPDILFEQAWNAFARQEYNRSLGKLVSYKSPALSFVFNPEIDVLRAQSYLALCLYDDANNVINEFNGRYTGIGEAVKRFVESHPASSDLPFYFETGKEALRESIYSEQGFNRMVDQFIRGPYFRDLVSAEDEVESEEYAVRRFDSMQRGVDHDPGRGFPGFLQQVLGWRLKTVRALGGMYVKNSLIDYHSALIADFEKMAFIKLEMLKRAKDKLVYHRARAEGERGWGNVVPRRRDYQYYWRFNGEFWDDELGDYVFGLESECGKNGA